MSSSWSALGAEIRQPYADPLSYLPLLAQALVPKENGLNAKLARSTASFRLSSDTIHRLGL